MAIPQDKVEKAVDQITDIVHSKKVKVLQIQKIAGLLNFMCRAIVPVRAFVRRLYYKIGSLKQHYHVKVDQEIRDDLLMWLELFQMGETVCRPFMDFSTKLQADELDFFTDASLAADKGIGGVFRNSYFWGKYPEGFIETCKPSIEFCELLAVAVAIHLFLKRLQNRRSVIFCDNESVVEMINASSTKSPTCMKLIRHITFLGIKWNAIFFCKHVPGLKNKQADFLSRMNMQGFKKVAKELGKELDKGLTLLPKELWPVPWAWFK